MPLHFWLCSCCMTTHTSQHNKDRHTTRALIKSKKNLWAILLIVHEHFQTFSTAAPSSPVNTIRCVISVSGLQLLEVPIHLEPHPSELVCVNGGIKMVCSAASRIIALDFCEVDVQLWQV